MWGKIPSCWPIRIGLDPLKTGPQREKLPHQRTSSSRNRTRWNARAPIWFVLLLSACRFRAGLAPRSVTRLISEWLLKRAVMDVSHIANVGLSRGQRVQFVTSSSPQDSGEAEILGKADDTCKDSSQDTPGVIRYSFKVNQGALGLAPAFVIANSARPLRRTGEGVAADLDGDRQPGHFRACTSSEGLHLTVWKGRPLEGQRKWHYYYYLG